MLRRGNVFILNQFNQGHLINQPLATPRSTAASRLGISARRNRHRRTVHPRHRQLDVGIPSGPGHLEIDAVRIDQTGPADLFNNIRLRAVHVYTDWRGDRVDRTRRKRRTQIDLGRNRMEDHPGGGEVSPAVARFPVGGEVSTMSN